MRVLTAALVLFAVYFPVAIYSARSYSGPQADGLRPLPVLSVAADGSCVWDLQRRRSSGIRVQDVR
jgi:hypothetical protein